jgi:hypothetical protein
MTAYRLPGATCGEEQMLVLDDGTSHRSASHRPGAVNGAHANHASEWDPYTLMRRAAGVRDALRRASELAPAAVWQETRVQLGALLDALIPGLLMALAAIGASAALGGAAGAVIGALAGGVGAVPGAVVGAQVGTDIGVAVLTWMGLAFLIPPLVGSLGELTSIVTGATRTAWDAFGRNDRDAEVERAATQYAHAVAVLMRLILIAIVIRLTAGQAGATTARALGTAGRASEGAAAASQATGDLILSLRRSRLGAGFADWVEANSAQLKSNPRLQPPRAAPTAVPRSSQASSPSQLRAESAAAQAEAAPARPAARPAEPPPQEVPISQQSNAAKGVFGEAKADQHMAGQNYEKLNGKITEIGDKPHGTGIDGVWKNTSPPPEYVISEAKYGSSKLSTLKDGTKQMSDTWVDDRLDKAVGRRMANQIREAIQNGDAEKWLLQVDEHGTVTKTVIPWDP